VLIVVAIGIAIEIKGLLIGQSADPEVESRLRDFLHRQEGIEKVFKIVTLQLGTSLMVSIKAAMKGSSAREVVGAINRTEAALRAEFPEVQWLFFEPDVSD